jgi:hypothetical protein
MTLEPDYYAYPITESPMTASSSSSLKPLERKKEIVKRR